MLPVFNVLLRYLGIKNEAGTLRSLGSNGFRSKGDKSNLSLENGPNGIASSRTGKKTSNSVFYRLPDENDSNDTARRDNSGAPLTPTDARLRPDVKGYEYTVKSLSAEERDSDSGDNIPLHGIRVERAFERSTATD